MPSKESVTGFCRTLVSEIRGLIWACQLAYRRLRSEINDEGLAPRLIALAEGLQIADRVRILPRTVVGSEKEQLFAAARVFVLPSYSENFGNTILEAMRRRVPVVVTPKVGVAEIVRESGGGLVVAGDPIALGAAICQLTPDADLARSIGEAGQRHAMAYYS
jgi:glycosyltransferase involved in cell wall biosynthesis